MLSSQDCLIFLSSFWGTCRTQGDSITLSSDLFMCTMGCLFRCSHTHAHAHNRYTYSFIMSLFSFALTVHHQCNSGQELKQEQCSICLRVGYLWRAQLCILYSPGLLTHTRFFPQQMAPITSIINQVNASWTCLRLLT